MESKGLIPNYPVGAVKVINQKTNELLLKYDDLTRDPSVDPSVDIEKIAKACGVKDVVLVSPDQLAGKHAVIQNNVVKIDKNDVFGQQLFDLAHEVGHIVFNHITKVIELKITLPGTGKNSESPIVISSVEYKAARQGTKKKSELSAEERAIEDFFDHFAACLLIPINRFQLWEDKTDKEIAEAFKVEEKCIKKRRQEVIYETNILTSAMKPCPVEAITDPDVKLDIEALMKELNSQ